MAKVHASELRFNASRFQPDVVHLCGSDIVDNNLLCPGVILVPVMCTNRVDGFIGVFNFSCNILINITIVKYSSHPLFPFMPVIIHQVVAFSDLVNVCIIPGAN